MQHFKERIYFCGAFKGFRRSAISLFEYKPFIVLDFIESVDAYSEFRQRIQQFN